MKALARQGFTLLEVMVAVVILAAGLSSLFTSEVGAIRIAQRARTMTIASMLARCKMGEVEERILKEGWPGTTLDGRDECCEGAEHAGFSCEYVVDRIVLPDAMGEGENTGGGGIKEMLQGGASGGAATGGAGGDPAAGVSIPITGPLGALTGMTGGPGAMGGGMGGGGGGDPLAAMIMEFTFPIMKPLIEEQVRRVNVTVRWKEGSADQDLEIVQFIVNELPMVIPDDENVDDNTTGGTTGGGPGGAAGPGGPAGGGAGAPGGGIPGGAGGGAGSGATR